MKTKDFSDKEMLDMYEFKRSYPRVEINSPISLLLSESLEADAIAQDISMEGLRILFDNETARLIENEKSTTELDISFALPSNNNEETIKAHCSIMYMLKLIDETLAMGVRITYIKEEQKNTLRRFIENSLEPK